MCNWTGVFDSRSARIGAGVAVSRGPLCQPA